MKKHPILSKVLRLVVAVSVVAGLLVLSISLGRQPTFKGRLIFTDMNLSGDLMHLGTIDQFDFQQGTRSALPRVPHGDFGELSAVDETHFYTAACFAMDGMMCSAYTSGILSLEEIDTLNIIDGVWQRNYIRPIWSPDRRYVGFIATTPIDEMPFRTGDPYVMKADGTGVIDLTPGVDNNGLALAWSPDSQRVAFSCQNEEALCISDVDGGHLQTFHISDERGVRDLAWSPDGAQIAMSLAAWESVDTELYVMNADGSDLRQLLDTVTGDHFYYEIVWSPDSSRLLVESSDWDNNGRSEIYIISRDGEIVRNLAQSVDGSAFIGVWSPDSTSVAFFSSQDDGVFLYVSRADGSEMQRLTSNSSLNATDTRGPSLFWVP